MKNLKYNSWFLAVLIVCFGITSCGDVTELNVDPNSPTDVPASNLLTGAQYSLYNLMASRGFNAEWGMLMVQQWAQNEYAEESRYLVDANSFNGTWTTFYASVLNELTVARNKITDDANIPADRKTNQLAIIDILMSDAYQTATDSWGAIPYTQAINAEFPNPAYDTQDVIYADLLAKLDGAVGSLNTGAGSFSSGDVIFGGDVASWKKLGASLLMRMAMRVSDVDAGAASTYISKAAGYGVIGSNADNALFVFDADPSLSNPLWIDAVINTRDDFAVSDVLVNTLEGIGDPRITAFAAVNNDMIYNGMPFGLTDAEAFALKSQTSRPSEGVRSATAPHVIMDHAEVCFLYAEAIERGILTGSAEEWYNAGITSSMEYWGFSDASAYIAANGYGTGTWKEVIGLQKWIAFYMNGPQAWAEHRRLDQPQLAVPAAAVVSSIPTRLPYPISEETNNGSAIGAVTSDINDITSRLWWDVN